MAIYRFLSLQNEGKSLAMYYFGFRDFLNRKLIFTNGHPNYRNVWINKDVLIAMAKRSADISNASFLLDEYWLWCSDSRKAMSADNILSSYFLLQSSKNNINIYTTAQTDKQDDSRLRDNAHFTCYCSRIMKKDGKVSKIDSPHRDLGEKINPYLYIRVEMFKQNIIGQSHYKTIEIPAMQYFRLYSTKEHIVSSQLEKIHIAEV